MVLVSATEMAPSILEPPNKQLHLTLLQCRLHYLPGDFCIVHSAREDKPTLEAGTAQMLYPPKANGLHWAPSTPWKVVTYLGGGGGGAHSNPSLPHPSVIASPPYYKLDKHLCPIKKRVGRHYYNFLHPGLHNLKLAARKIP